VGDAGGDIVPDMEWKIRSFFISLFITMVLHILRETLWNAQVLLVESFGLYPETCLLINVPAFFLTFLPSLIGAYIADSDVKIFGTLNIIPILGATVGSLSSPFLMMMLPWITEYYLVSGYFHDSIMLYISVGLIGGILGQAVRAWKEHRKHIGTQKPHGVRFRGRYPKEERIKS